MSEGMPRSEVRGNQPDRDPVLELGALESLSDAIGAEAVAGLVPALRDSIARYRVNLEGSLTAGDTAATRRVAHALKGVCVQFGAVEAGELAAMMEACAQTPQDARAVMIDLSAALDALDAALAALGGSGATPAAR